MRAVRDLFRTNPNNEWDFIPAFHHVGIARADPIRQLCRILEGDVALLPFEMRERRADLGIAGFMQMLGTIDVFAGDGKYVFLSISPQAYTTISDEAVLVYDAEDLVLNYGAFIRPFDFQDSYYDICKKITGMKICPTRQFPESVSVIRADIKRFRNRHEIRGNDALGYLRTYAESRVRDVYAELLVPGELPILDAIEVGVKESDYSASGSPGRDVLFAPIDRIVKVLRCDRKPSEWR